MRLRWTVNVRAFLTMSPLLLLMSCQSGHIEAEMPENRHDAHEVGFYAGDVLTRTEILQNGLSAAWEKGDIIAMWAKASSGSYVFANQHFMTYGTDAGRGFFTSTLTSPMPDDQYTYYCCYPVPQSMDGSDVTFEIPSIQDGKVSEGADIMIGTPAVHGPMTAIPEHDDHSNLSMKLNRMLHHFRFFVPESDIVLQGQTIEKIVVTFPKKVAGNIRFNLEDPAQAPVLTEGTDEITLRLSENIDVSGAGEYDYACMAFAPTAFSSWLWMATRWVLPSAACAGTMWKARKLLLWVIWKVCM